ncbi:MAG: SpoIIE family protein phosphatase [Ruminiclostridium sp.]|nr:SpoIIE family protein phosphatase [Ruminiclostridium sp.]
MKKIFGITLGGIHQKILTFCMVIMLIIILILGLAAYFQSAILTNVVERTRIEQQEAITNVSEETMYSVTEAALTKTNALQAYIADDMFADLKDDVMTLQKLAVGLFEHMDSFEPNPFYLPDPANEGKLTAQVLYEEGVDYKNSRSLGVAAHMTDTMAALIEITGNMNTFYFGFSDGTLICVDKHSANKFDENGKQISFLVRDRPWYKNAVEAGDLYFTGVLSDSYTGELCITCSAPVYAKGKLIGVIGADLFLGAVSDYVNASIMSGGFICILNEKGQVIFAPDNNGIFTVDTFDKAEDVRLSENTELAEFVNKAMSGSTGMCTVCANDKLYYMTGSPIPTVGWSAISVVAKDLTTQSTEYLLSEYERINAEASDSFKKDSVSTIGAMIILLMCIIIVILGGVVHFAGRIVKPIEEMTNNIIESSRTGKLFEMRDIYRTKDEIEVLAESFDDLSKKTKQYIIDITEITKEKERIGTELELARKIQAGMLPYIYPAFPDRKEFDIYATMTPAKEVGGDFYDFFLLDNDHLGMVMADVSGKGVPAALFMMMSKILINNYAVQGLSPGKSLEMTNDTICRHNEDEMFVTVWFGILEISTGKITAANAGHECPIIRRANGDFEVLNDKHGFVIGAMSGLKYKEYEIQLEVGGTLFLYTDGVPEATRADEELFGQERMIEALNKNKECGPRELLPKIKEEIDAFVGDADPFDDLTMLAVKLLQ